MKKNKKSPRASKRSKIKRRYEEKLFRWFTTSIFLLVLIAIVIFFINKLEAKNLQDEVIAIVNDEKITANGLDNWYKITINPEFRNTIKKEDFLIDSLVPQKILVQEAEKNKIKVNKDEVETALGQFLIDSGLSLRDFEKKLREEGTDLGYVKESFKQRLLINKLFEQYIFSGIDVSSSEINEIFKKTKSFDPSLTSGEVKQIIGEQLMKRKQIEASKAYTNQLMSKAEIQLFINNKEIISFTETNDKVCKENDKPVIRLYTTSSCGPCKWIKERFDKVMGDYLEEGKIVAYHWELDTGDNALTKEIEEAIPKQEIEIFKKYNRESTVPTFVFGCKYVRVGNFYEEADDLDAEEEEFRAVVEKLIQS